MQAEPSARSARAETQGERVSAIFNAVLLIAVFAFLAVMALVHGERV